MLDLQDVLVPKNRDTPQPVAAQVTETVQLVQDRSNEINFLQKEVESLELKLADAEQQLKEFGSVIEETKNRRVQKNGKL